MSLNCPLRRIYYYELWINYYGRFLNILVNDIKPYILNTKWYNKFNKKLYGGVIKDILFDIKIVIDKIRNEWMKQFFPIYFNYIYFYYLGYYDLHKLKYINNLIDYENYNLQLITNINHILKYINKTEDNIKYYLKNIS
jgi:hypothetical protein